MVGCVDLRCPWCGVNLADGGTTLETYDSDLSSHVTETPCVPWLDEQNMNLR